MKTENDLLKKWQQFLTEGRFAQQPSEVGKSTIDTFIMQGFEHALEEADELITCFLEEYE